METAAGAALTEDADAFILPIAAGTFVPGANVSSAHQSADDISSILLALELQYHPLSGTDSAYSS